MRLGMATTIHQEPRGVLKHVFTLVQAIGLVYLIGLGMVLFGVAVELTARGAIELVSWIAELTR